MSKRRRSSARATLFEAVVTGGYLGYFPGAPGTAGSLGAVALYLLIATYLPSQSPVVVPALVVLFAMTPVALAGWMKTRYRNDSDPSCCVVDEGAGLMTATLFLSRYSPWVVAGLAFAFFRIFDVAKPAPIRRVERFPHGVGIALDDVIAGVYANVCVRLALRLLDVPPIGS